MTGPYDPPVEVATPDPIHRRWIRLASGDRLSLAIAICVAATVFVAFVDWSQFGASP